MDENNYDNNNDNDDNNNNTNNYQLNNNISKNSFSYAHLADLHLGSWRDSSLRKLSTAAFDLAIHTCISKKYDFVLFAGDIFNTALPAIDIVNHIAKKLQELKQAKIPLYVIPGSHDFSPTGRSMIDVLESAGLLINVCKGTVNPDTKQLELKYTIDPKTGSKITGMLGRRGLLDRSYYENLARTPLENETGYRIFMFHTTLTELKPKHLEMLDSHAASFLPKNQNYYPGGHIHHKSIIELEGYGPMSYTGPLFPNNFSELEKYSHGGFYQITVNRKDENQFTQQIEWLPLKVKEHLAFQINCTNKSKEQIHEEFNHLLSSKDSRENIVTLRLSGSIQNLQLKDLEISKFTDLANQKEVYALLLNTQKIQRDEFEGISLSMDSNPEETEIALIKEHLTTTDKTKSEYEFQLTKSLLSTLNTTKKEGEKSYDFQSRIIESCKVLFSDNAPIKNIE